MFDSASRLKLPVLGTKPCLFRDPITDGFSHAKCHKAHDEQQDALHRLGNITGKSLLLQSHAMHCFLAEFRL